MLWTIAVILFVLWLIGWLGFHVLGAAIHILVILAVIFVILAIVRRA
ncbi:MAG: lmo0937 family membrane protein [Chthoniobacterales bacterium]